MKRIFSLLLVTILMFAVSVPAFAESNISETVTVDGEEITVTILQDDSLYKVVETTDSNGTVTTRFNKETKELTTYESGEQQNALIVNSTSGEVNSGPPKSKDGPSYIDGPTDSLAYSQSNSDTWFGLYYKTSFYENDRVGWVVSLSDAAFPYYSQTSSNRGDLESFSDAVDEAAAKEFQVEAEVAAGVLAAMVGVLTSTLSGGLTTIVGALIAVGAITTAAVTAYYAWLANKDAEAAYYQLKY
ncbi:geobacillin-26 family protein [Lysinibacillus sphaericus]